MMQYLCINIPSIYVRIEPQDEKKLSFTRIEYIHTFAANDDLLTKYYHNILTRNKKAVCKKGRYMHFAICIFCILARHIIINDYIINQLTKK